MFCTTEMLRQYHDANLKII